MLADLEHSTQSEVEHIGLEDLVDTDPQTGQPKVLKSVDIQIKPKAVRNWSR